MPSGTNRQASNALKFLGQPLIPSALIATTSPHLGALGSQWANDIIGIEVDVAADKMKTRYVEKI